MDAAGHEVIVRARSAAKLSYCPSCGRPSARVHSRYRRQVSDLPSAGRRVHLEITARKFRCPGTGCKQRVFAERFEGGTIRRSARRTDRLNVIVHHHGLALGGRPGAGFSRRLMLPVSNDTLLRVVRRRAKQPVDPITVAGIDDWVFRRNHRYGSIVCDLERRRIVTLLPDREVATVEAWLRHHQEIGGVPILVQAREFIDRFHSMIRERTEAEFDTWVSEARTSLVASFATGISNDKAAVRAAITEPWSNCQTEGQITKLKLPKHQMYGRATIDLL